MAEWYCQAISKGRVPACEWEILACERYLDMLKKARSGKDEYIWSDPHAVDICDFMEKLPHVKAFEGSIVLEPVQCFWLCGIFGFREPGTLLRWVRSASLWIPRKNTKTIIGAGIALFCANCENEPGAEVAISAGSEKQAHIPYDTIRAMLAKEKDLARFYGAYDTRLYCDFRKTGGTIALATARAKNLDGFNPHLVLAEELHSQSQDVIGVLRTAQGVRKNPLFLSISTAGRDTNSAAYADWKACQSVLRSKLKAKRLFTVIYAGDKSDRDKRFDRKVVEKLNPLFGISLNPVSLEEEIIEAKKSESKLNEYLRTRLDIWAREAGGLIEAEDWSACTDLRLKLDVFKGYPMYVGIDLASRSDLNAAAFMVKFEDTVYATFKYWIPERAYRLNDDRFADSFHEWHEKGWITFTPGSYIDYKVILDDILKMLVGHRVIGVGLDDYQANLMASEIETKGKVQTFIVPKRAVFLTQPTEDLIARVQDPSLFQHDGNPLTAWCAENVVGYWDANDNILPKKEKPGSKANIDGMDALIIANSLRIDDEAGILGRQTKKLNKEIPNPYMNRGLAGS